MTVEGAVSYIQYAYTGPGDYTFPFVIFDVDDIAVVYTDTEGLSHNLARITDFTVTVTEGVDGGTVTIHVPQNPTAPWATAGGTLDIRRSLPITQLTDWVNNDPLDAEILEISFDRIVMILQQLDTDIAIGTAESNWKGTWVQGYPYLPQDVVVAPNNSIYVCIIAHTSSTGGLPEDDFADDLALGNWQIAIDVEYIEDLTQQVTDMYNQISLWYSDIAGWYPDINNKYNAILAIETQVIQYAEYAANCAQAAYEAAAGIIPDPSLGSDGQVAVVDGTPGTGWRFEYPGGSAGGMIWEVWDTITPVTQGKGFAIDTTGGQVAIDLPAAPVNGQVIGFVDMKGTFNTNNLILQKAAGDTIMGVDEDMTISTAHTSVVLTFLEVENDWQVVMTTPQQGGDTPAVSGLTHMTLTVTAADILAGLPLTIGVAPQGMNVQTTQVVVESVFDGGAEINVGMDGDEDLLLNTAFIDETVEGAYGKANNLAYAGAPTFKAFPAGSPTIGQARITIYFN